MADRLSDTRPTGRETVRQLADGLQVFGIGSQPVTLARIALAGLPRHGMTVAGAIAATARVRGDRVALLDDRGAVTYAELGRAAGRLAAALDHHGLVAPGGRVAVVCEDNRDLFVAAAAAGLAGAQVAQLSPRMGRDSFAAWLAGHDGVDLIIHAPSAGRLLAGYSGPGLATTAVVELVAATPPGRPAPDHARHSTSVMVTSGTTGTPKGIAIRRRSSQPLAAFALAGATRVRPGVPTLVWPPLYHGYGLAAAVLCLAVGSPVVTASAVGGSLSGDAGAAALAAIRRYGVEVVFGVPAQLRALAEALAADPAPPPRLRRILSGSDALDQATVTALHQAVGPVLANYYGSTEAGTFSMATGAMVANDACVGRPIVGSRVQIVDADGQPVPVGETGRIRVRSLMASVADQPGSRWLTMGDEGYLDADGRLYVLGRVGPVARLGGEFVEPGTVEALLATLPGVRRASVQVVPDERYGQRLSATVVPEPARQPDPETWRTAIREALGAAAVPREITLAADPS